MIKRSNEELLIFTVPNGITIIRILLIPVFVYLGWDRNHLVWSAILLGFIGATDWVDGFLARRLNQVSLIGKIIDPSADRLLLIAAAIVAIHLNLIPLWLLGIIFLREIAVSTVVGTAALKYKQRLDVVIYGKAGTLLMMFGFPFFVMAGAHIYLHKFFYYGGFVFMLPGLAILFIALSSYIKKLIALRTQST